LTAALATAAQVLPMLLITSGVSTLLITLCHAHLQGQSGREGRHNMVKPIGFSSNQASEW